jgi:hypothetical protein
MLAKRTPKETKGLRVTNELARVLVTRSNKISSQSCLSGGFFFARTVECFP